MPRSTRKACDACALRKVQCDGREPCRRCIASSFECTFLKSHGKPGPKGPRKRTTEAIQTFQSKASFNKPQPEEDIGDRWTSPQEESATSNLPFDDVHELDGSLPSDTDWTKAFTGSISPDAVQPSASTRIHSSIINHYLSLHEFRAYSIWPVFDTQSIMDRILADAGDMEAYGLATAICAASITQFQVKGDNDPTSADYPACSDLFEAESRRARLTYDHLEKMTIWSLLTSFFLHVYAANIGKKSTTTLLLSEAVTIMHVIGLHMRSYYDNLDDDQQQYCLRVYWLLFISERYLCHHPFLTLRVQANSKQEPIPSNTTSPPSSNERQISHPSTPAPIAPP
jgi:hypothetical protein